MLDKETIEDFFRKNEEKINQARSLLDLIGKVEFKVLNFNLTVYKVGVTIRADLTFNDEGKK